VPVVAVDQRELQEDQPGQVGAVRRHRGEVGAAVLDRPPPRQRHPGEPDRRREHRAVQRGRRGPGAAEGVAGSRREGVPVQLTSRVLRGGQDRLAGRRRRGDREPVFEAARVPRARRGRLVDELVEPGGQPGAERVERVAVLLLQPGHPVGGGSAALDVLVQQVAVHPAAGHRLDARPHLRMSDALGSGVRGRVGQGDRVVADVLPGDPAPVADRRARHELQPAAPQRQPQVEGDRVGAERERQRAPFHHGLQRASGGKRARRTGRVGVRAEPGERTGDDRVGGRHRRAAVGRLELAELPLPGQQPQRVPDLGAQRAGEVGGAGPSLQAVPQAHRREVPMGQGRREVGDTELTHGRPSTSRWRRRDRC
jgi:hypothetical protein